MYSILAYYFFCPIGDPHAEVARHKAFLADKDIRCRIYISHEGINGQMSASNEAGAAYMNWLKADLRFADVVFKKHAYHTHVFPRQTVKWREQLVAMDARVDMTQVGEHTPPSKFRAMLEERDEDVLLLDVRNRYEWEIGHFEGAELPALETFREFPTYAQQLKTERDPERIKVMMYCTGGIRCELFSALLKQEGFRNVFQLQGGVIQYGLEEGSAHFHGKLFVFDDRLSVPLAQDGEDEVISRCFFCKRASDLYYNCANAECNALFLSCLECAEERAGCCSTTCQGAPKVRPFAREERPVPFRRLAK